MTSRFFVNNSNGRLAGVFVDGAIPPQNTTEVFTLPPDASKYYWDFNTGDWALYVKTQQEIDAEVTEDLNRAINVSDIDKAMFLLFVDIWQNANPGMDNATARQQVRNRLRTHLDSIKKDPDTPLSPGA